MKRISAYDCDFLLSLYKRMVTIRFFEDHVKRLFLEGVMPGTIHQCQGQEATAVGVCSALKPDDYITSTHRPHGHALAKGLTPLEILTELFGRATGCCKGKGGSMHIGNMDKGMVPAIAIVAGSMPLAAGMALAFKLQQSAQVVACFFGDGASSEGAFHEAVNMAAIWDLPIVFACENNLYGASTRIEKVTKLGTVSERAKGYGIKTQTVDGNDILEVYEASKQAVKMCRSGKGPVLLELMTYRLTGHSRRDPGLYQPKEEREHWKSRDPIKLFGEALLWRKDIDSNDIKDIEREVEKQILDAIEQARHEPKPTTRDLTTDVFV